MSTSFISIWLKRMPHQNLALVGCLCILIGMFVSRAMMSIGMMLLISNAIMHNQLLANVKSYLKQPLWVGLGFYFILFSISILWSANTSYAIERMQIMLPFLVLPFAFHSVPITNRKLLDGIVAAFLILLCSGISWSLLQYFGNKAAFDEGYGVAHVIPTPFKNDHIRFSLAVVLGICFAFDFLLRYQQKWVRISTLFFIVYAVVYLHILSAKTGILLFYILAFCFLLFLVSKQQYRKWALSSLIGLVLLPIIMYAVSTSFRNKLSYVKYSISQMQNRELQPEVSDEGRLISYRYALDAIKQKPLFGIGLGDVADEMKLYYSLDFPGRNVIVLLPHNQFLMAGMAMGIIGILYLLILQIVLCRQLLQNGFLGFAFWLMMFFTLMIEPLYETQYGTCMFIFFLLLILQRRNVEV
ncbi:MAG: O-antigen ligase family protein [Bacteroidetes bacterium]|nr:O-antigen ligase family protein [Bacteroidota bacterium]